MRRDVDDGGTDGEDPIAVARGAEGNALPAVGRRRRASALVVDGVRVRHGLHVAPERVSLSAVQDVSVDPRFGARRHHDGDHGDYARSGPVPPLKVRERRVEPQPLEARAQPVVQDGRVRQVSGESGDGSPAPRDADQEGGCSRRDCGVGNGRVGSFAIGHGRDLSPGVRGT